MKTRIQKTLSVVAIALACSTFSHADVVTYIDLLSDPAVQIIATNNAIVTNTTASTSAIGGFRTLVLDTKGGSLFTGANILGVDGSASQLLLSSPSATATNNFVAKWAGVDGVSGFTPVDFTGGFGTDFSLLKSTLKFSLLNADSSSSFTWTFRDTNNVVASYSGTLSNNLPPNPAIPYSISLASFSGSGIIDWTSINFISLSGGGIPGLDLALGGSMNVSAQNIPEPGTWAAAGILLLAALYIRRRRARSTDVAGEAPAAA